MNLIVLSATSQPTVCKLERSSAFVNVKGKKPKPLQLNLCA